MVRCDGCGMWVHPGCADMDEETYTSYFNNLPGYERYECPDCKGEEGCVKCGWRIDLAHFSRKQRKEGFEAGLEVQQMLCRQRRRHCKSGIWLQGCSTRRKDGSFPDPYSHTPHFHARMGSEAPKHAQQRLIEKRRTPAQRAEELRLRRVWSCRRWLAQGMDWRCRGSL